jgi:hypothetical protein
MYEYINKWGIKIFVLTGIILFAGACKKCSECSYKYGNNIVSSGEFCGSKKQVREFEQTWQDSAKAVNEIAVCLRK